MFPTDGITFLGENILKECTTCLFQHSTCFRLTLLFPSGKMLIWITEKNDVFVCDREKAGGGAKIDN